MPPQIPLFQITGTQPTNGGNGNTFLSAGNQAFQGQLASQDPNKVVSTLNGVNYNFAGNPIGAATPAGGGGAAANTAPAAADPYAQWGGIDKFNQYKDQYNTGLSNIQGGATDAFGALQSNLQGSAENLFNTVRTGQQGIDNSRSTNELNRLNGIQDILGYVRSGMRQGATRLSNSNAIDSSATGALANAYSLLGNSQSRSVNNQAAVQGHAIDQSQNELNLQRDNGVTDFHRIRDAQVATISGDLRAKLSALDQQAAGVSLPDRIAIDAERQRLIDQGQSQLAQVDSWLTNQLGTVNPQSQDQTIAQANALRLAGTATGNPFSIGDFGQGTPLSLSNGAPIDQLPIFTRNKRTV